MTYNSILINNEIHVAGVNAYVPLGMEDLNGNKFKFLMNDSNVKSIIHGYHHGIIWKNNGDVLVFGLNNFGQLGFASIGSDHINKPTVLLNDLQIKSICCGSNHTMILKNNGEIFVFGDNRYCQLGLKHNNYICTPTLLIKDPEIKSIYCGGDHSMILKNNGELFVFGCNVFGQLGFGNFENINVPTLLMKDPDIELIKCGCYHSMILKNNGDLFVFGNNMCGQLGLGIGDYKNINVPTFLTKIPEIKSIQCGLRHTMILKNNGELLVCGDNRSGQLGLEVEQNDTVCKLTKLMKDTNVKSICCRGDYSMILKNNGELYAFGDNTYGQLGLEKDELNIHTPTLILTNSTINLQEQQIQIMWKHHNHIHYSTKFKQRIDTFMFFLKRNYMSTGLKIPKFVVFEIIKFTI